MTVNWGGILTAVGCLAGLAVGLHLFFGWLSARRQQQSVAEGATPRRWAWRSTLVVLALIVLAFAAGTAAIGLVHQAAWLATSPEPLAERTSVRTLAAEMQSQNNLKQIGLAAHSYHEGAKHLPPGGTFDERGRAMHSWQTLLLPYIEKAHLYRRIDLKAPWDHPTNSEVFRTIVIEYQSPAVEQDRTPAGLALSHYAANVHVLGAAPRSLKDFPDGASNTLLAGEAAGNFKPWGHPLNWRDPARGLNQSPDGFGSQAHRRVVLFVFADGSVRPLKTDIDLATLRALGTPAGGEQLPEGWDQ
jgi:hypothetical protein